MQEHSIAWRNRIIRENLGTGYEVWSLDGPKPPADARIRDLTQSLNRKYSDADIAYERSEHQLLELVNAAEGVERQIEQMHVHARQAEEVAARYRKMFAGQPTPDHETGLSDEPVSAVWYDFFNVLIWTRAVEDRVSRRNVEGTPPRLGLLHFVALGALHDAIETALTEFQAAGKLSEVRHLTNYTLHGGTLKGPGTPSAVLLPDRIAFYLPDQVSDAVLHWFEFTYHNRRDLFEYVEQLWAETCRFIDRTLDAFAEAVPERFRRS